MIKPIIQAPDERLLQPSLPVGLQPIGDLIGNLIDTRIKHRAAGLSAVQIGTHLRVVAVSPNLCEGFSILINPEIIERSEQMMDTVEGCMSIRFGKPRFRMRRHAIIKIRFMDRRGEGFEVEARGFASQLIQHEVDHLDGKLIVADKTVAA